MSKNFEEMEGKVSDYAHEIKDMLSELLHDDRVDSELVEMFYGITGDEIRQWNCLFMRKELDLIHIQG